MRRLLPCRLSPTTTHQAKAINRLRDQGKSNQIEGGVAWILHEAGDFLISGCCLVCSGEFPAGGRGVEDPEESWGGSDGSVKGFSSLDGVVPRSAPLRVEPRVPIRGAVQLGLVRPGAVVRVAGRRLGRGRRRRAAPPRCGYYGSPPRRYETAAAEGSGIGSGPVRSPAGPCGASFRAACRQPGQQHPILVPLDLLGQSRKTLGKLTHTTRQLPPGSAAWVTADAAVETTA